MCVCADDDGDTESSHLLDQPLAGVLVSMAPLVNASGIDLADKAQLLDEVAAGVIIGHLVCKDSTFRYACIRITYTNLHPELLSPAYIQGWLHAFRDNCDKQKNI